MALAPYPYWTVEFRFVDNNGNYASTGVNYAAALAYADVATQAAALAAALDAVSDAALVQYTISTGFREDAAVDPPPSSEVERKLAIPLNTALRTGAVRVEVPSPIFGIEIDGTDIVDEANPAVAALLEVLVDGTLGAGNGPVTYYGGAINGHGAPVIVHRNRRARR